MAKRFGAGGLGLFVLAYTGTVVASTISRWGIDQIMLRNLAGHYAHAEYVAFRALLIRSLGLFLIVSIMISTAMWLLSPVMASHLFAKPELNTLLQILALSIVPFSFLQLLGEGLRAIGQTVLSSLTQGTLVPLFSLICIVFVPEGQTVNIVAVSYTVACLAAAASALLSSSPLWSLPQSPGEKAETLSLWQLLTTATPVAWITIFSVWLGFSETLLLGLFRPADEVGLYSAALRIIVVVNFLLVAFNTVLAPRFAVLFRQGETHKLGALAKHATLTMLVLSCPFFLMVFLFPDFLLGWFGGEFVAASTTLFILAMGQLVNLGTGPVGAILLMTGHERYLQRHMIITVVTNFVLACALVPSFGIIGAACSAAAGMVMLNFLSLRTVYSLFIGSKV